MRTRLRAVTLLELLVALGVMIVLAGIVLPLVTRAKLRAKEASDLSTLRQLGQAASIYSDQYGTRPTGCPDLVRSNLINEASCTGLADNTSEGTANLFALAHSGNASHYKSVVTSYKNSFLGLREINATSTDLAVELESAKSIGWLVDLSSAQASTPFGLYWSGRYRRLLNDGAVVTRSSVGTNVLVDGKPVKAYLIISLFGDFPKDWTPKEF